MPSWNATHSHEQEAGDKYYCRSTFDAQTVFSGAYSI